MVQRKRNAFTQGNLASVEAANETEKKISFLSGGKSTRATPANFMDYSLAARPGISWLL